jgi:CheY-like chemotaxis protein
MDTIGSTSASGSASAVRNKPRILVVDDTPDSARVIRARLHHAGMDCLTAHDGKTALEIAASQPFDVILVDVSMPDMDGYEVCEHLKANDETRDVPVLFLSGNPQSEDRQRGFEVGGSDYIAKPVDQVELFGKVQSVLRVKQTLDNLKSQLEAVEQQGQEQTMLGQKLNSLQQGMVSALWQRIFGQLAGNIAQDISAPLISAIGSTRLAMIEEKLPPGMRERLNLLEINLRQVNDKIRRLLLVSQPSRQPHIIYLSGLVEDITELMKYDLRKNNVEVTTRLDPACQWKGMPSELSRAIIYIFSNAIEAVSGREDAQVTIKLERSDARQYIRIADNGPGIPKSFNDRLFDQSFTTKGPPHTGAGLYLANAIVKAANGAIEFRSPAEKTGTGTEFSINLPLNVPVQA